jgi:hypothetical protein
MIVDFPNFGYILEKIPADLFDKLKSEINYYQQNFEKIPHVKNWLAGHLEKEFRLNESPIKDELETYVLNLADRYNNRFGYQNTIQVLTEDRDFVMDKHCWINFQLKNQFNPVHNHSGIYSFVIWIKIPYNFDEELEISPGKDAIENLSGHFQFIYTDAIGRPATHPLKVDKSFEGKILFFPSKLFHTVYPFYSSDEYRISLAGNLLFR